MPARIHKHTGMNMEINETHCPHKKTDIFTGN